ncbi:alpha/beta hydrolase [Asticcacaulis sp.]|uniref:alpha/beta hydrolase n=1 Tax=Asticcacaulis sp. TaxID=1872648 RepID=UPI002B6EB317|nr:alpha/beta hydrolase [Asticcacaulis sp.]HTM82547.1 alpha/beta hydrolase [Asticcacaulis sp.]
MTAAPSPRVIALSNGADNVPEGAWPDRKLASVTRAELWAFVVAQPKGQVLVCAGGGYQQLMTDREGVEVAAWLNANGYSAYVLVHRLPGADNGNGGVWPADIALADGLAALEHISGGPLFLMGLSSGGHLAGALACQPGVTAAGVIIAYAPINANHRDYKAPKGKADYPPVEKQTFYDAWPIGIRAEPHGVPACPVFLAYALHDTSVPVEHALNFILTARDAGLDLDAHIFGQAPHGFALRDTAGTHVAWPNLALQWMGARL